MSSEYNSKLISELYAAENAKEASEISDDMVEIGDLVFVRPIFDAYKKFEKGSIAPAKQILVF